MKPRHAQLGLWVVAAGITVALGAASAQLTWHLMGETGGTAVMAPSAFPSEAPARPPDLTPILALAPFGTAAVQTSEPQAKETTLGLILHGVVVAASPSESIALIAAPGGKVVAYGTDASLPGGAKLVQILADKVMLRIGGETETLSFPKLSDRSGVAAIRARLPANVTGTPVQSGSALSSDAVIDGYRRRIAANPKAVLDDLGVTATPEGYRIGSDPSLGVRQAGLRAGDMITRVNGVEVGDIEQDRRLFEKIAASGRARVEVVRDGRRVILSFPLR